MGWTGRMLAVAACALAASAARVAAAPRSGTAECLSGDGRTETLSAVEPRGELALASGARAVLGSVRWPDDPEIAKAATERLLALRGRPLTVVARGEADRWGRLRIDALSEADGPVDLAGDLVGAGLAQVDAGEGDALCRPGLLAVEEAARTAGLGLWHQPSLEASDGLLACARRRGGSSWSRARSAMSASARAGPISTSRPGGRTGSRSPCRNALGAGCANMV